MPLPLTVYCSDTVDRELQKLPMYGTKAPEVKAEERDKYIAAHPPSLEALRLCTSISEVFVVLYLLYQ